MANEWNTLSKKAPKIQDAKNRVLNEKLFSLIKKYAPKSGTAFDYGCGWGEFADAVSQKGYATEAFDEADGMVAQAKSQYTKPRFYTNTEFVKKLPTLAGKFDLVTSNLVLCILKKKDQDVMLENLKILAKDGAPIIVSLCNPCSDYLTVGIVTKRIRSHVWNPKYDKEFKYKKIVHENGIEFTDYHRPLSYYIQLFKKHGLQILDIAESEVLDTQAHPDFIAFVLKTKEG